MSVSLAMLVRVRWLLLDVGCSRNRRFQPAGSGRRVAVAISTMRSQPRRPMRGAALDTRASPDAQSSSCSNRRSCRRRRRPASSSRDPRAWCRVSTCGHKTRGGAWRSMRGGVALAALVASAWAVRIDLEPDVRCCVLRLVAGGGGTRRVVGKRLATEGVLGFE